MLSFASRYCWQSAKESENFSMGAWAVRQCDLCRLKAIRLYRNRRVIYGFAHRVVESKRPAPAIPVFDNVLKWAGGRRLRDDPIEQQSRFTMTTAKKPISGEDHCPAKDDQHPVPTPSAQDKILVVGFRTGRLGNRLVLFANIIGFAAEHGYRVVNVAFHSYAHLFENTRRDIYCRYPIVRHRSLFDVIPGAAPAIRKTRIFYQIIRCASVWNYHLPILGKRVFTLREISQPTILLDSPEVQSRMADARIVFVHGWRIRAPESVRRHADLIREYFRPIAEYEQASRQAVERLRQKANVVVGVHIRLGDNWKWMGGQCYFPVSRYVTWMQELAEQFSGKKVAFLVCSDEPRQEQEFPGLAVGFGPGSQMGDLHALAKCDWIFGPLSTFSQWAAFYGNKPLLFLRDQNDSVRLDRFNFTDLLEIP
jgi:hypothetical protein